MGVKGISVMNLGEETPRWMSTLFISLFFQKIRCLIFKTDRPQRNLTLLQAIRVLTFLRAGCKSILMSNFCLLGKIFCVFEMFEMGLSFAQNDRNEEYKAKVPFQTALAIQNAMSKYLKSKKTHFPGESWHYTFFLFRTHVKTPLCSLVYIEVPMWNTAVTASSFILLLVSNEVSMGVVSTTVNKICFVPNILPEMGADSWTGQKCCFSRDFFLFTCWVVSNSFVTPWTVAHQAPLSMGFSRQEHWSGLPCPPPGDLPNPGTEPTSPAVPALAGRSLEVILDKQDKQRKTRNILWHNNSSSAHIRVQNECLKKKKLDIQFSG